MAAAMAWVARIFAVVLVMTAPGWAGNWLDQRWQTRWLMPTGMALGFLAGLAYLLTVTRSPPSGRNDE